MKRHTLESGYEDIYITIYDNVEIIDEGPFSENIELDDDSDELEDDFVPELIFPGNDEIGEA